MIKVFGILGLWILTKGKNKFDGNYFPRNCPPRENIE
jgi:hypothetical protein